ncbi:hypothetical protein TWF694_005347 [Orbilia ellipsospora]|uniref:F-box domain-containing protein n=1 Tax=Orbilia ellipsospora TaxID=2528407 RepID=A0AAV9WSU8_9PEZI
MASHPVTVCHDASQDSGFKVYLPAELWLIVYRNLSCEELKAISLCSKRHREWVIPQLYSNIKLSEESIAAFCEGKFAALKSLVTDVTFDKLVFPTAADLGPQIKLLRKYCNALRLFPNIQGIRVVYSTIEWFEWHIIAGIWFKLSEYSWFYDLKRFSVEPVIFNELSPGWVPALDAIESCNIQDSNFLKVTKIRRTVTEFDHLRNTIKYSDIPFPRKLEEITTHKFGLQPLSLHSYHPRYHKTTHSPSLFYWKCIDTLKRLKFHCPSFRGDYLCGCRSPISENPASWSCPVTQFTTVEELWLILDEGNSSDAVGFTRRMFPNVRKLRIDAADRVTFYKEGVHGHMAHLVRLEEARVPWPTSWNGESHAHVLPSELCELVNSWAPGPPRLEFVDFAMGYEPAEDAYYYGDSSAIPTGCPIEICRISPGSEKYFFRREKGNREGNNKFMDRREEIDSFACL